MEARVLLRYFVLVHLAFTLINGHPLLDSLFILGDDKVRIDLRVTEDRKENTKETHFLLTTILDIKDLRDIVKMIAEKHRDKMDVGYVTYIQQVNFSSSGNHVDETGGDLVSDSEHNQLPEEQIASSSKNDTTWKNNSTGQSCGDGNSDKKRINSSLPFSYPHSNVLNKIKRRPRKGENSDKIEKVMRDNQRSLQIVLIDEIYDIIRDALSLVRKWPGIKKKIVEDFSNIIEEDSRRYDGYYDKDVQDRLLHLYAKARILHRELLRDLILRNERERTAVNDRASSYDYRSRPRPMRFKNDSSDQYYLQHFLDWLTRKQTLDKSTDYGATTSEKTYENSKKDVTRLKNDTTDSLKVDPLKSANEKPVNRMYKQDVVANETAVRFGFDYLWDLPIENHPNNLSSTTSNASVSEGHNSHYQDVGEDLGNFSAGFTTELENNIKNVSVTHNNKTSNGSSIVKKVAEDDTKFPKITTEESNTEITKGENTKDSNVQNVLFPPLLEINGTADENDDMKNTTIIHIKDPSKNVIKNLTITNEFLAPPNPTVATTNTKQNTSFLSQNEKPKQSKDDSKQNQFVMDHILDAVDKVLLFD